MIVALDFTSSDPSFFYSGEACPSTPGERCIRDTNGKIIDLDLLFDGMKNPIRLTSVGLQSAMELPLGDAALRKRIIRFRDVHGVISMGTNSQLMQNRVLIINEQDSFLTTYNNPIIKEIEEIESTTHHQNMILTDLDGVGTADRGFDLHSFVITTEQGVSRTLTDVKVVIDPGNRFIVIPRIENVSQQRIVGMVLKLDENRSIPISDDQIGNNVLLSYNVEKIILGRPFVRSLGRLYLDALILIDRC